VMYKMEIKRTSNPAVGRLHCVFKLLILQNGGQSRRRIHRGFIGVG
jgi:hypothetical protein